MFISVFFVALPEPAVAQHETPPVTVTVTDTGGAPIALAEVKITANAKVTEVLSDEQGRIIINSDAWESARTLHVDVSAVGYVSANLDLAGRTATGTVIRLKSAAADSGDILVVARTISRPFSPQTLNFLDIVTDPRAQADPILAVNNLPASTNVTGSSRITFRGNRASINRAFLNDTPVYEFSTGSELDSSTENRSVFGVVLADDVETYPSNPPAYLAGATGGAVRIVTPDNKPTATTVSVTDLGISGGRSIASQSGTDFVALYASLTDLTLHRAINPKLESLYKSIRSGSAGAFAHLTTASGGSVNLLLQAEAADDEFPFTSYGAQNVFRLQPVKERAVVSASAPLSGMVLGTNAAFTHSEVSESFGRAQVSSTNDYGFGSITLASGSTQDRVNIRGGVDTEYIRQTSDTALTIVTVNRSPQSTLQSFASELRQITGHVFASYHFSNTLLFSLGARHTIASNIGLGLSLQAGMTLSSTDRKHKLIVSGGQYSGAAVPTRAYYGPAARSVSRQIAADYSWQFFRGVLGLSGYMSHERTEGGPFTANYLQVSSVLDNLTGFSRRTESEGIEAYATWTPVHRIETRLSFATVKQAMWLGQDQRRGANDYPEIVRASVKYSTYSLDSLSLSLTHRTGEPYTPAIGVSDVFGSKVPLYGDVNTARLPSYFSLDVSISSHLRLAGVPGKPLVFVALNNLTSHRNPSSQVLTLPGEAAAFRNLAGRTVLFGATTTF